MPAISVILPTCDRAPLLLRALRSVLAQDWTDLEVLVVDSNRTTPPLRAQPRLDPAWQDPRVRLLDAVRPAGSGAARNLALDEARGEWIAYLDDDDVYRPDKLSRQMALAQRTGVPLVSCGFEILLPGRRLVRQAGREVFRGDELLLDGIWRPPVLLHRAGPLRFGDGRAGTDLYFAQAFFAQHGLREVPNVPAALVEVDQRHRGHAFADREAAWRSFRRTVRDFGPRYSPAARRTCLLRGMIFRAQGGHGSWLALARLLAAHLRGDPRRAWRLALNSVGYRLPFLRRFVVRA